MLKRAALYLQKTRGKSYRPASETTDATDRVVVAGGGIGGLSTALALAKCNIPVTVLEKACSLRTEGASVALLANGWRALDALSIGDELRVNNPRSTEICFLTSKYEVLSRFDLDPAEKDTEMRGVMRRNVLHKLVEKLPPNTIQFDKGLKSVNLSDPNRPVLKLEDDSQMKCRVFIGADGERSAAACSLGLPPSRFTGFAAIRCISHFDELPISKPTFRFHMGPEARAGMYQLENNKIYWFFVLKFPKNFRIESKEELWELTKKLAHGYEGIFRTCFEHVDPESISITKFYDRVLSPFSTIGKGTVSLVGDAFHPMTPNLAQGAALALEDAVVLGRHLKAVNGLNATDDELISALRAYEKERKPRATNVTLRARVIGKFSGITAGAVVPIRNAIFSKLPMKKIFLSTARYECGRLDSENDHSNDI